MFWLILGTMKTSSRGCKMLEIKYDYTSCIWQLSGPGGTFISTPKVEDIRKYYTTRQSIIDYLIPLGGELEFEDDVLWVYLNHERVYNVHTSTIVPERMFCRTVESFMIHMDLRIRPYGTGWVKGSYGWTKGSNWVCSLDETGWYYRYNNLDTNTFVALQDPSGDILDALFEVFE